MDSEERALLKQILEHQRAAPQRHEALLREVDAVKAEVVRLSGQVGTLDARVGHIEKELGKVEEAADEALEKSGAWELARIKQERDDLKDSQKHWGRYVVTALVSFIAGGGLLLLGRLLK